MLAADTQLWRSTLACWTRHSPMTTFAQRCVARPRPSPADCRFVGAKTCCCHAAHHYTAAADAADPMTAASSMPAGAPAAAAVAAAACGGSPALDPAATVHSVRHDAVGSSCPCSSGASPPSGPAAGTSCSAIEVFVSLSQWECPPRNACHPLHTRLLRVEVLGCRPRRWLVDL